MAKLERITVTMPEEMAAKMRAAVESGEYATTSEIVREALRDWEEYQERRQAKLQRLRAEIEKGMKGEGRSMDDVFNDLFKKLKDKKAKAT
ncbi:MAG: type II toxin-antitoxin system ParD family antitoxin [Sphingorhabdus sp.]|uniref:ribbon-helix-helix domain-containing protein n=1 Tax=Sphingorhabdus sp. TaxID=1902408 RepID=UPI0038FD1400